MTILNRDWQVDRKGLGIPMGAFLKSRIKSRSPATGAEWSVLHAEYGAGCVYLAVEGVVDGHDERHVRGVVAQVEHLPGVDGAIRYRLIDEQEMNLAVPANGRAEGLRSKPALDVYYRCPTAVLSLLTPTNSSVALAWREKAREWARGRELAGAREVRPGDVLTYATQQPFSDGVDRSIFVALSVDNSTNRIYAYAVADDMLLVLDANDPRLAVRRPGLDRDAKIESFVVHKTVPVEGVGEVSVVFEPAEFMAERSAGARFVGVAESPTAAREYCTYMNQLVLERGHGPTGMVNDVDWSL